MVVGLEMGEVVGCLVRSFGQGEVGARWWLGNEMVGQDTGITSGGRTFVHFGSKSGVGSIVWLGDSRWGGNGGVRRLWWWETAVAGRGARDGEFEAAGSQH